ncbi:type II secretion system F family protein [Roseospira visakhapatnamensis]|uniref:Tight adherence protein C n=1 Tax=Roseospira visakhapatnamensis TaxID=390880 RepID=A0A7W6RGJ5_9PROT|nr:type II secretion system F family protein [Roseospira visakhapatnamensis]MBB4267571.1 tight adherence protein C [Roseospira visakhapatnamensis]
MELTFLGFSVETIISVLVFVGAFATVIAVVLPFLGRDSRATRLRSISKAREEMSRQQRDVAAAQRSARWRPQKSVATANRLVQLLKLDRLIAMPGLKAQLVRAGYRQPYAAQVFIAIRFALALGLFLFAGFFLIFLVKIELSFLQRLLILGIAPIIGFYVPQILLKNAVDKRQAEMTLAFPDALDLLVICAEAGLSIEAAFNRVPDEIGETSPALAEEMGLTSAEMAFLNDRRRAYANLAERTGLKMIKDLTVTLIQSEKYGTSVTDALKVLSQENRDERMSRAESKAAALPAKLTIPMIIFFLPVLLMVILGPAIIQLMELR